MIPRCDHCGGLKRRVGGAGAVQALCSCSSKPRSATVVQKPRGDGPRTQAATQAAQERRMARGESSKARVRELHAQGLTARETAEQLGLSEGYVHTLRSRMGLRARARRRGADS